MNKPFASLVTILSLACGASAFGQGLLNIRPAKDEFERRLPLTIALTAGGGYDSNTESAPSGLENESAYLNFGGELVYSGGNRRTNYSLSAGYTGYYFLDPAPGTQEYQQSARLSFNVRHKFSPSTSISNTSYLAYEFEPNYTIGSGTTRRSEEYLYGHNDLSVAHAWGRKFSTVTGYTISGIDYQDDNSGESYLAHLFHQEFRYQISKLTTLAATYRFALANYDNGFGDYTSHYLLAGVDHNFTRKLFGSFRVGAEMRDRDNGGSNTSPYFEGTLSYRIDKDSSLYTYARYGYEDSAIGTYEDRTSFRMGVTAQRRLTSRLGASVGLHYVHDDFNQSAGEDDSYNEDTFSVSVGLDYSLYKNISLTTNYGFTTVTSGNEFREYDRHNVSLGVRATF